MTDCFLFFSKYLPILLFCQFDIVLIVTFIYKFAYLGHYLFSILFNLTDLRRLPFN